MIWLRLGFVRGKALVLVFTWHVNSLRTCGAASGPRFRHAGDGNINGRNNNINLSQQSAWVSCPSMSCAGRVRRGPAAPWTVPSGCAMSSDDRTGKEETDDLDQGAQAGHADGGGSNDGGYRDRKSRDRRTEKLNGPKGGGGGSGGGGKDASVSDTNAGDASSKAALERQFSRPSAPAQKLSEGLGKGSPSRTQRLRLQRENLDLRWRMAKKRDATVCCRQCAGEGVCECRFCAGTGLFQIGNDLMLHPVSGRPPPCPVCRSKGEEVCTRCKGAGRIAAWLLRSERAGDLSGDLE